MAYSTLASGVNWTTGSPTIKFTFAYERQRSGADMQYRFRTSVSKLASPSYFSNSIIQKTTLNGTVVNTRTIKDSGDSTWSAFNEYFPSSSGWYTVSGKTSGTVKVSFKMYSNGSRNATYTYTLAVDPAASQIMVEDFTIDTSLSITPTVVRYDDSFTDNITVSLGTTTIATFNNYTKDSPLEFTNDQLNTIYSLMPSNAMTFNFTLETYSGDTSIGSNIATPTGTLINANPILTTNSFTYKDTSALTSLTGNNQTIIGGYSNLTLTADTGSNAPQPQKGATLTSYIINQSTFNYITPFTTTINNYSLNSVEIVAEDNRGNSTNINLPVNYLAYTPLSISEATAEREDSVGSTVTFSFSGKMWVGNFGTTTNSIVTTSYTIQKENGTPTQGTATISVTVDSSGNLSFNGVLAGDDNGAFAVDSNYTVTIYLADRLNNALNTTFAIVLKIYAGIPAIKLNKNKITSLNFDENMVAPNPLPITAGGTGATTSNGALTNILGSSLIPITNGGTGAATAEEAIKNLSYNKVLATSGMYMLSNHTVYLSEPVSAQPTGIVCVWSRYVSSDSTPQKDDSFIFHFVPKTFVASWIGYGHSQMMCRYQTTTTYAVKYIYIYDDNIVGHAANNSGNAASYVLRYVIGV